MVKKTRSPSDEGSPLTRIVSASAQQIWNAGLGALAMAEREGSRVFEGLSAVGAALHGGARDEAQRKTQAAAGAVTSARSSATATWDKLEQMFEHRVARALNALQIPTAADVQGLAERVNTLQKTVRDLVETDEAGAPPRRAAKATRVKKVPAKKKKAPARKKSTAKKA